MTNTKVENDDFGAASEPKDTSEGVNGEVRKMNADTWLCADPGCRKRNVKTVERCQQCGMSRKMSKGFQRRGGGGNTRGGGGRGRGKKDSWGWNRNQMDRRKKHGVIVDDDPVQNMFGLMSKELDYRNDKRERIVKLSRDITIESKRIIFCLHRIRSEKDKATVLGEAEQRLKNVKDKMWYYMARELKGEDHYQFIKAYSDGLQEWVEALSFYHYLSYGKLISFAEVEKELIFKNRKVRNKKVEEKDEITDETQGSVLKENEEAQSLQLGEDEEIQNKGTEVGSSNKVDGDLALEIFQGNLDNDEKETFVEGNVEKANVSEPEDSTIGVEVTPSKQSPMISVTVPQAEFILGLADLSGELMRNAINSLGSGNIDVCFILLDFLQSITDGFTRLPKYEAPKDIGQKMLTLKQSCQKVESACYAICVRGSEIPKTRWADIFNDVEEKGRQAEDCNGGDIFI